MALQREGERAPKTAIEGASGRVRKSDRGGFWWHHGKQDPVRCLVCAGMVNERTVSDIYDIRSNRAPYGTGPQRYRLASHACTASCAFMDELL